MSLRTIRRAELADGETRLTVANNLAVRWALESAGVEFTNGDQPGVKLRRPSSSPERSPGAAHKEKTINRHLEAENIKLNTAIALALEVHDRDGTGFRNERSKVMLAFAGRLLPLGLQPAFTP